MGWKISSVRKKLDLINQKCHLDEAEPVELGHEVSFQLVHRPPLLCLEEKVMLDIPDISENAGYTGYLDVLVQSTG